MTLRLRRIAPPPARSARFPLPVALLLLLGACMPPAGGWDLAALEARHPALADAALRGHRLGDLAPHFLPELLLRTNGLDATMEHAAGEPELGVRFFLCRFELRNAVTWGWRGESSATRVAETQRALDAVAGAVPGLRLREVQEGAQISVELTTGAGRRGTGRASADCELRIETPNAPNAPNDQGDPAFRAELVRASVRVHTDQADALGRSQALPPEEFIGALAHEVGHALGFGAHTATRDDLLARSVDGARWSGRRIAAATGDSGRGRFEARTLAALYAVPSGTEVARGTLTPASARWVRQLAQLAREAGWKGPFTRVGDRSGELFWRTPAGGRPALWAPRPDAPWPEPMVLVPNREARDLLHGERD